MCFKSWGTLIALILLASCSVKEDRNGCPCLLSIAFENMPPGPVDYDLRGLDGSELAQGTVMRDTTLAFQVPRNGVRLTAASGVTGGSGFHIPYGSECPPVYMYCNSVDTGHEYVLVKPVLHKGYCVLNLILDGPPGDGKPLGVAVRGSVNGAGADSRPTYGEFRCNVSGHCLIPRQNPSDMLWLDIVMEDSIVRTFALGTYLRNAGYDWTEPDLADISIELSLSVTTLRMSTNDWSVTTTLNVEI